MKNATSVKERLKNYAKKNNRIVQDIFIVYVLERTLYRISVSDYRDKFESGTNDIFQFDGMKNTVKGIIYVQACFI